MRRMMLRRLPLKNRQTLTLKSLALLQAAF